MKGKTVPGSHAGTDQWGFRIGTRNAFLMRALEAGEKTKDEIRLEFLEQFPDSAGKSTFSVFFTDLIRPFGSASVSRCVHIESGGGRLRLDPERARQVKAAVEAGILEEINDLEGATGTDLHHHENVYDTESCSDCDHEVARHQGPRVVANKCCVAIMNEVAVFVIALDGFAELLNRPTGSRVRRQGDGGRQP